MYVAPRSIFSIGVCNIPKQGVQNAQSSSPDGSVYYLYPGTYNENGITVLNRPGVWSCNTGLAQIR